MGTKDPLVSIITPAYNRASYLEVTIRSVLDQDYPHVEYIVLDDGSTDNTPDVLRRFEGRLRGERHPNMGETRTVNKGMRMATGEILCIVNSDDLLYPGAISAAVDFLGKHPNVLVAYPDWNYIDAQGNVLHHVQVPEHDYLFMVAEHRCYVGPAAFIRRRALDLVVGRDPQFKYVGDFDFWLRLGLHGDFARIPKTLGTFRVHPGSASEAMRGGAMAAEDIRMLNCFFAQPDLPLAVRRQKGNAYGAGHLHAARVAGAARWTKYCHYIMFLLWTPFAGFALFRQQYLAPKPWFQCLEQIGGRVRRKVRVFRT